MPKKKKMTKAEPTQNRFRITCYTETERVGPVLAELTKLGVNNVGYELITDVLRYKRNTNRKSPLHGARLPKVPKQPAKRKAQHAPGTVLKIMTGWVAKHSTFTAKAALEFAESRKIAISAFWSALRHLREDDKMIRRVGPGKYRVVRPVKKAVVKRIQRTNGRDHAVEAVVHG